MNSNVSLRTVASESESKAPRLAGRRARQSARVRWVLPLCAAVGLALLFAPRARAADPKPGESLYLQKCAKCHGKQGEGNPALAKMMKVEIHPLSSEQVQKKTDEELRKAIVEGYGKMKPIAGLSDEQVSSLVAYIRSLAR